MGKESTLEAVLYEAFELANTRRGEMGLGRRKLDDKDTVTRGAAKGVPRELMGSYKVTVWLRPWEYADLLRLKADNPGFRGGVTALIAKLISDALPASVRHARPVPRKPLAERLKLRPNHGKIKVAA